MYIVSYSPYTVAKVYECSLENVLLRIREFYRLTVAIHSVKLVIEPRARLAEISLRQVRPRD
jgi:hypothetical protein